MNALSQPLAGSPWREKRSRADANRITAVAQPIVVQLARTNFGGSAWHQIEAPYGPRCKGRLAVFSDDAVAPSSLLAPCR